MQNSTCCKVPIDDIVGLCNTCVRCIGNQGRSVVNKQDCVPLGLWTSVQCLSLSINLGTRNPLNHLLEQTRKFFRCNSMIFDKLLSSSVISEIDSTTVWVSKSELIVMVKSLLPTRHDRPLKPHMSSQNIHEKNWEINNTWMVFIKDEIQNIITLKHGSPRNNNHITIFEASSPSCVTSVVVLEKEILAQTKI